MRFFLVSEKGNACSLLIGAVDIIDDFGIENFPHLVRDEEGL